MRFKVVETIQRVFYVEADNAVQAEVRVGMARKLEPEDLIEETSKVTCEGEWTDSLEFTLIAIDGNSRLHFRYVYAPNERWAKEEFDSAYGWDSQFELHQIVPGHVEPAPPDVPA